MEAQTQSPNRLDQIRAHITLPILRRSLGLLEGHHQSFLKGHGIDFDDLALYSPGDDVGDIDWKSSARAGIPILRRFIRQTNITVTLIADTGKGMSASAPDGQPKSATALYMATLISYLARERGDKVALIAGHHEDILQRPGRSSTHDLELFLHLLDQHFSISNPPSDLGTLLLRARDTVRSRSLIVILTDATQFTDANLTFLRQLRLRHEVLVIKVANANPFEVGKNKQLADVDADLNLPAFFRRNKKLIRAFNEHSHQINTQQNQLLSRWGIDAMEATNPAQGLQEFVRLLGRRQLTHG